MKRRMNSSIVIYINIIKTVDEIHSFDSARYICEYHYDY